MAIYAGRVVLVKIDTNAVGGTGANWQSLGNQRGGSLSRSSDVVDATSKGDSGWPTAVVTRTPWSVSVDGAKDPNDSAWAHLLARWEAKTFVWVQVDESAVGGTKKEGKVLITSLESEFPEPDLVTFSVELQGNGALATSP